MQGFEIYVNPYCDRCGDHISRLLEILQARGYAPPPVHDVLAHLDTAVRLRITRTPALVWDGKLLIQGTLDPDQVQALIDRVSNEVESP